MESFFKLSCIFLWLIWGTTLSGFFGVSQIEDRYTILEFLPGFKMIRTLLLATCALLLGMGFIGACCIKCDVSNLGCTLAFIVPTLLVSGGLSIYLLASLKSDFSVDMFHLDKQIFEMSYDIFRTKKHVPHFLHHSQRSYNCCGIFGVKDYRVFFLDPETPRDAPYTCCNSVDNAEENRCRSFDPSKVKDEDVLYDIFVNKEWPNPKLNRTGYSKQMIRALYNITRNFSNETLANSQYLNPNLTFPLNVTKARNLHLAGCIEHIRRNSEDLLGIYIRFSFYLLASGMVIVGLYIQSCVKARRLASRSEDVAVGTEVDKVTLVEVDPVTGDNKVTVSIRDVVSQHEVEGELQRQRLMPVQSDTRKESIKHDKWKVGLNSGSSASNPSSKLKRNRK